MNSRPHTAPIPPAPTRRQDRQPTSNNPPPTARCPTRSPGRGRAGKGPKPLDGLYHIGVDEVSYRKHHHYLTLVTDHDSGTVVWAAEGKDADTLRGFFDELGGDRAAQIEAVSLDMGRAYPKAVAERAPHAEICWDPFHVVALANKALDVVRRAHWNHLRSTVDAAIAKQFKGARWALLKAAERLSDAQADQLVRMSTSFGPTVTGRIRANVATATH